MITVIQLFRRFELILRFYGAGLVNTVFGYSLFFLLLAAGINIYISQIIGHLIGMMFNYAVFRRHVFTEATPSLKRFVGAYAVNYVIGLCLILLFSFALTSPYVIGGLAAVIASLINFFILKRYVFNDHRAAAL